jgi:uncharacterized LabA/DUF88 family protein
MEYSSPPGKRCFCYIDGFNFYYGMLRGIGAYKWLDFSRLIHLLRPLDSIEKIKYFTALVGGSTNSSPQRDRQRKYWKVLETIPNLEIVHGKLEERDQECRVTSCPRRGSIFKKRQEKQTDVNIALAMALDALDFAPDVVALFSGDSDLLPAMRVIRQRCPKIIPVVYIPVLPAEQKQRALHEYQSLQIQVHSIPERFLLQSQFAKIVLVEGKNLTRPPEWQ